MAKTKKIKLHTENIEIEVGNFKMKSDNGVQFNVSIDGKELLDVTEVVIKASGDDWIKVFIKLQPPFKRDDQGQIIL